MDPITAIGAVASIVQLSQVALSLSKTLYSLGTAVGSANDDIQALADDLKTFSQSLTLLSRLLEDSKSWYSDDIYLLTAKIIKDCAELYVKIDKILATLGGNGKSTWKMRVKFVYKEGQIRKLMKRLRDMKGTLATILMSLQVDLQLSLLNISSSSKIQREPERPLQPETVQILVDAQKAAEQTGYLSKNTIRTEQVVRTSEKCFGTLTTQYEEVRRVPDVGRRGISSDLLKVSGLQEEPQSLSEGSIQPSSEMSRDIETHSPHAPHDSIRSLFQPITMMVNHQVPQGTGQNEALSLERTLSKSLKSKSSVESFQTAVSVQQSFHEPEEPLEAQNSVDQEVEAVRNIIHAFKTAIEVFSKLVEKRRLDMKQGLYPTAKDLEKSLADGEREFKCTHDRHLKLLGACYVQAFTNSHHAVLQHISSSLMTDIVMPLHQYSADHVRIWSSDFETLRTCSERCRAQAIFIIVGVALPLANGHPDIKIESQSSGFLPRMAGKTPVPNATSSPQPHPQNADSETTIPFIGQTFKRFDNTCREESQSAEPEIIIRPDKKDPVLLTETSPGHSTSSFAYSPGNPLMNGLSADSPLHHQQQMIIKQQRAQQAARQAQLNQAQPVPQGGVCQTQSIGQASPLQKPITRQPVANGIPVPSTIAQQHQLQRLRRYQQMQSGASNSGMPQPQLQGVQCQMQASPLPGQQPQPPQMPVNDQTHLDPSVWQSLTASMNPQQRQRLASLPPDKLKEILNKLQKARQLQMNYTLSQMSNGRMTGTQPNMAMPGNQNVHVPTAPTLTQPPFQFGLSTPQGELAYNGEPETAQENVHIPHRKNQKPNNIGSTALDANLEMTPPISGQAPPLRDSLGPSSMIFKPSSSGHVVELPNPNSQQLDLPAFSVAQNKTNETTQARIRQASEEQFLSPFLTKRTRRMPFLAKRTRRMSTTHRGLPPPAAMPLPQHTEQPLSLAQPPLNQPMGHLTAPKEWDKVLTSDAYWYDQRIFNSQEAQHQQTPEQVAEQQFQVDARTTAQHMALQSQPGGVGPEQLSPQQSPAKVKIENSLTTSGSSVTSFEDPWQQSDFMDPSLQMPSARIEQGGTTPSNLFDGIIAGKSKAENVQTPAFVPNADPQTLKPGPPSKRRGSGASYHSHNSHDDFISDKLMEKGRCAYPECGKWFSDLKSHMMTHENQRSEKSIQTIPPIEARLKRSNHGEEEDDDFDMQTGYDGSAIYDQQNQLNFPEYNQTSDMDMFAPHQLQLDYSPISDMNRLKRQKLDTYWEAYDGPHQHDTSPKTQPTSDADQSSAALRQPNELPKSHKGNAHVDVLSIDQLRSDDLFRKLWWQAYFSLKTSQPTIFEYLSYALEKDYGWFPSDISDRNLSKSVEYLVQGLSAKKWEGRPYLIPLAGYRANIARIVTMIMSQLGLERPVVGWACVGVFLSIYDEVLETLDPTILTTNIGAITGSFQQVQDLAGLLARYAVMENLYHQGPSLTLTPEYENGLQDLCFAILQYFGNAFIVARSIGKELSESGYKNRERCDVLIEQIKEKDRRCQGFRVIVEADDNDDESDNTVIEDVSDGSWEILDNEVSSSGLLVN